MARPPFRLITGPAGDYFYFQEAVLERIPRENPIAYDFLYFLPVKRAVRLFQEHLIRAHPAGVLPEPPVSTFYDFLTRLYQTLPGARKVVSPAMRLFLVEEILKQESAHLRFFSPISAGRRGLIRKVDALLTELREYGYRGGTLLEQLETAELDADESRLRDFARLIDAFDGILGDRLIDEAGAIQTVLDQLTPELWQERFGHVKMIYLSGYDLFSQPMIDFIRIIREVCPVTVKLDYQPDHPELFGHIDPAYHALLDLEPERIEDAPDGPWIDALFRKGGESGPRHDIGRDVLIQPAANQRDEVAFIARYIRRLHQHDGIALHRIGVTFPSLERYAPLIRDIFPRHGLPFNLSTGFPLNQSPLIRSFLLLLEVPLTGYDLNRITQLIGSPFYRPRFDTERLLGTTDVRWIADALRQTGLPPGWPRRLESHLDYLRDRIDPEDVPDAAERERQRERIDAMRVRGDLLERLLSDLGKLEKARSVTDFRDVFLKTLTTLGFLEWYRRDNSDLSPREREQEYRAFNRFNKLLDQFSWIVTNLHGERSLPLKELYQFLKLLVDRDTYNAREWDNFGVQIMPRLEVPAMRPDVLIFGGMVEGEFPRPFVHDVFFHDADRDKLGLAATEDLLGQDAYMLYSALRGTTRRIVFTYPRFRNETALVPSNFLSVLADQCRVRRRERVPSSRFLRSGADALESVARAIGDPRAAIDKLRLRDLNRWLALQRFHPHRREAVRFWMPRVRDTIRRRRYHTFGPHEGMVGGNADIRRRLTARFGEGPFSITRLEAYAGCPIRFYFQYVLRIEETEEIAESGMTPLERGNLVHQTLFRFYRELVVDGVADRPWEHRERLETIAREEFERLPFEGMLFDMEQERYFGGAGRPGVWERFLAEEARQMTALGFTPRYLELAFGRTGARSEQDPASREAPLELTRDGRRVQVVGKIDRIDLDGDGRAFILDYKTGSPSGGAAQMYEGTALQLPIYAALLPELLAEAGTAPDPVLLAHYLVKDPDTCERKLLAYDATRGIQPRGKGQRTAALPGGALRDAAGEPVDFPALLDAAERHLFRYAEGISAGHFRHTVDPEGTFCQSHCPYRRMCRKDTAKLLKSGTAGLPGGGDA